MEFDRETFKAECDRRREEGLIVKGKTYDIKEQIKELGGIWDGRQKQWLMPDQEAVDTCNQAMSGTKPVQNYEEPAPESEDIETEEDDNLPF